MKKYFYIFILIFALGFVAHKPSMNGEFIWDDYSLIINNKVIKNFNFNNIKSLFLKNYFYNDNYSFQKEKFANQVGYYRPIANLSYMILYKLFKLNPKPWHIVNIIFHCLNAFLLFLILFYITRNNWISSLTSILFTIHPSFHQVIDYCTGFVDILCLFFGLLSILFIFLWINKEKFICFEGIISIIFYSLSILTKEITILIPFFCFLYSVIIDKKNIFYNAKKCLIIFIPFLLLMMWREYLNISLANSFNVFHSIKFYKSIIFLLVIYIKNIVFPFFPQFMQQYLPIMQTFSNIDYVFVILIGFIFILILNFSDKKIIILALLWFFINWIIISNIIPMHPDIKDVALYYGMHLTYFSSIGLLMILSLFLCIDFFKSLRYLLIFLMFLSFTLQTHRNSYIWSKPDLLYNHVILNNKFNPGAYINLGIYYNIKGQHKSALRQYLTLYNYLEKNKLDDKSLKEQCAVNIAYSFEKLSDFQNAEKYYKIALEYNPNNKLAIQGLKFLNSD